MINFCETLSVQDQMQVKKICHLLGSTIDDKDIEECIECYTTLIGSTQYRKRGILLYVLYTISGMMSTDENVKNKAKTSLKKFLKLEKQGVI